MIVDKSKKVIAFLGVFMASITFVFLYSVALGSKLLLSIKLIIKLFCLIWLRWYWL